MVETLNSTHEERPHHTQMTSQLLAETLNLTTQLTFMNYISPCQLHNGFIDDPCNNFGLLKVNDSIALQFVHETGKLPKIH
jgi:hypothetical protein